MSDKDFAHQLRIASPCNVDWDSMVGNDRVRFCRHCNLSVHNIDFASSKQIRRLIARSGDRLCVNYRKADLRRHEFSGTPVLHKIGRRTSIIAASAFSATVSISTAVASTSNLRQTAFPNEAVFAARLNDQFSASRAGQVYGVLLDPNGAVIAGAAVSLRNSETNEVHNSFTTGTGEYRFEGLKPGTYHLSITASWFDKRDVPNVVVRADDSLRIDQTLSIATVDPNVNAEGGPENYVRVGGAVAMSPPVDPLVKAAYEDDLKELKTVLLSQSDVNIRDKETQTSALEYAVQNANREMVQVLLWAKVDLNARDNSGQTVLMILGEKATTELVWDLIHAGAKVNARDNDGDTPLISVASINNVEALKVLLDAGAKVNATNNDGKTALMMAAESGLVNNVRALIMAGADVNARDKTGRTALRFASSVGETAVVRLLKAHGAIEFEVKEKP